MLPTPPPHSPQPTPLHTRDVGHTKIPPTPISSLPPHPRPPKRRAGTQELFALGISNLLGSVFSSYPITGSFSRSAVNNSVGAKSQLAGFVTAIMMLLTLLALTRFFYFLPLFCLAAIVISSVTNLVDVAEARYLWTVKKSDFVLWMVAFLGTLFLGVQARAAPSQAPRAADAAIACASI